MSNSSAVRKPHFGTLYGANTVVDGYTLTHYKAKDGRQYRVVMGRDGLPIITSHASARSWVPSWQELIELAVAAGVDREEGVNQCH